MSPHHPTRGLRERRTKMDFMHILGQKEAIWNTILVFLRQRAPQTSRGPGKLPPPFPPSRQAWSIVA